ncbi:MAG: acyl carrier protein [Phycisphaerae bacterium]
MSRDEVFTKVKEVLVDALGVNDEDVTDQAKVMADLGAESIDILDIAFRLEKQFNIKIPRGELFLPDDILNNPDYVDAGKMTSKGLEKLREAMPHANLAEFEKNPDINDMTNLFTVDLIVNYVERKLAA